MMNKWDYNRIVLNVYKVEVGVFLDKDNDEYEEYKNVYDKKHSYYEENSVLFLDYNKAVDYAKNYVDNGVNGTYAIISKLKYDSEEIYGGRTQLEIDYAMADINSIIGGGYVEDIGMFNGLYSLDNVIYSLYKVRNEENPYFMGKGNGEIIENFVKTKEELVVDFMFDNDYINGSEYDHWFEDDIISVDQKIVCLYLALEEMRKLHLAVEKEKELEENITDILVKYENK